ncbi:MAG: hypothetical protein ACK5LK_04915 [Chthoniobacterales bacterium]
MSFFLKNPVRHILLVILFFIFPKLAQASDAVAFVGAGYGRTEVDSLMKKIVPQVDGLEAEDCGTYLKAEDFVNYRMVVIVGMLEKEYTPEESDIIYEYVNKGGSLVLVHHGPKNLRIGGTDADRRQSYLFGRSDYIRGAAACVVHEPDASLLADVLTADSEPFWLRSTVLLNGTEFENIIGSDDHVLVGRLIVGDGEVIYLGQEFFRLAQTAKKEGKDAALEGWVQIWKNILAPQ